MLLPLAKDARALCKVSHAMHSSALPPFEEVNHPSLSGERTGGSLYGSQVSRPDEGKQLARHIGPL